MKKPFLLRIDSELWDDLNRWAKDELRSVNGQIEFLLREAVQRRRRASRAEGDKPVQSNRNEL
ncbi:MAG: hypothetical protein NTW86_18250 [Candidatus Sumerlaeota bacterium]|nr:hypothetical protein [Candidatus Sumerlaeota bacterium]